ncbi:glycoside hydrolase family 5 protein [Caenimonas sp. SL110]|uniref:glycoside hydrolase family 5 protein n=1 Tax=Caenimonas sp. SL110 TaxID=1450524 RepID=UPI00137929E8|nr:glycoside hydrolase family 5 protein [Caenimonas sp. SL110]
MKNMRLLLTLLHTLLAFVITPSIAQTPPGAGKAAPSCAAVSAQTCATARALGRGINLGNMLDAPREGDWGVRFEPDYVEKIAGRFDAVRLPVRWSNHAAATADAKLDEAFAARVDKVIDALLARGLYVILNMHHYSQIHGDPLHPNESAVDAAVLDARLVSMWRQLAVRYKDRSPRLVFELLNEPHGRLGGDTWNDLAARTLAAVRPSNPTRVVLIGPGEWNNVSELPRLKLPQDRHLIVTIHNYDPFAFTHQGVDHLAKPFPVGTTCCDAGQRKSLVDALDSAQRWSKASGYPLHLGEFGAYEKADMKSRETYTRMVRDEAERRAISWAYWEFASSFGVYSPASGTWVEPIRRALLD